MRIFYTTLFCLFGFTISAQAPDNDDCSNAKPIGEVMDDTFSNVNATTDGPLHLNSPCPGSGEPEVDSLYNDIWYLYTPTFTGTALFTLCGTANFDSKIAVYQPGSACPPEDTDLISCNEDGANCANSTSEVIFPVIEGDSYLLRLAGFGTESPGEEGEGTFSVLEFVPVVENDFCFGAIPITTGLDQEFDSFGATTDGPSHPEGPCFGFGDLSIQSDIWFSFTADFTGPILWSTCDQITYDSRLGVYGPNADCSDLSDANLYACNDDGSGCSDYSSALFFDVVEGDTYLLRLGGWNGATGDGTFDLINQSPPEAPSNDLCNAAIEVAVNQVGNNDTNSGTTIGANFESNNIVFSPCGPFPASGNFGDFAEVWYEFNNGGTEEIILNFFSLTNNASFSIDIWEDCSLPTDTLVFVNNCTRLIGEESIAISDTLGLFANTPTDYIMRVSTFLTFDLPGDFQFQLLAVEPSGFETPSALIGDVKLSPNPVSSSLNLEIPLNRKSELSYSIHNLLGEEVMRNRIGHAPSGVHQQLINVESLNPGVYIVNVIIDNQPVGIKFVKQ